MAKRSVVQDYWLEVQQVKLFLTVKPSPSGPKRRVGIPALVNNAQSVHADSERILGVTPRTLAMLSIEFTTKGSA
jgi:hypothetical protein